MQGLVGNPSCTPSQGLEREYYWVPNYGKVFLGCVLMIGIVCLTASSSYPVAKTHIHPGGKYACKTNTKGSDAANNHCTWILLSCWAIRR